MGGLITEEELARIVNPNPWRSVTPIVPPTSPPLATAAEVASLRAEVESLKARVEALKKSAKQCPMCGAPHIERRSYVPTSRPEQWWDCRNCNYYWAEAR